MKEVDRLDEALAEHYRTGDYVPLGMATQGNWPTVRQELESLRANQRTGHIIHGDATDDAWNERAFDQQKARAEAAGAENRRLREGLREIEACAGYPVMVREKARALLADSPDGGGAK